MRGVFGDAGLGGAAEGVAEQAAHILIFGVIVGAGEEMRGATRG